MKQSNEKKYMTFKPEFRKFEKTRRKDFDKYFPQNILVVTPSMQQK